MPKVSREHLEARRQEILSAASRCFAEKGFHRTTMQNIVDESGLSAGAIYRYFESKDQIIQAIADARHAREMRALRGAIDPDATAKTLRQFARLFFDPLRDAEERVQRRVGIEMWAEALHDSAVLETAREGINEPLRLFDEVIRDAQQRGELSPHIAPDAFGRMMIALFHGFVLQQAWDEVEVEPYLTVIDWMLDRITREAP